MHNIDGDDNLIIFGNHLQSYDNRSGRSRVAPTTRLDFCTLL